MMGSQEDNVFRLLLNYWIIKNDLLTYVALSLARSSSKGRDFVSNFKF